MARLWQSLQLLLAILVALVAFTYQVKKSYISIHDVSAVDHYVEDTLRFLNNEYNSQSDDEYNFRIIRILRIQKVVSEWLPSSPHHSQHLETTGAMGNVLLLQ